MFTYYSGTQPLVITVIVCHTTYVVNQGQHVNNIDTITLDDYLELKIDEVIIYETYDKLSGDEYADAVLSTIA